MCDRLLVPWDRNDMLVLKKYILIGKQQNAQTSNGTISQFSFCFFGEDRVWFLSKWKWNLNFPHSTLLEVLRHDLVLFLASKFQTANVIVFKALRTSIWTKQFKLATPSWHARNVQLWCSRKCGKQTKTLSGVETRRPDNTALENEDMHPCWCLQGKVTKNVVSWEGPQLLQAGGGEIPDFFFVPQGEERVTVCGVSVGEGKNFACRVLSLSAQPTWTHVHFIRGRVIGEGAQHIFPKSVFTTHRLTKFSHRARRGFSTAETFEQHKPSDTIGKMRQGRMQSLPVVRTVVFSALFVPSSQQSSRHLLQFECFSILSQLMPATKIIKFVVWIFLKLKLQRWKFNLNFVLVSLAWTTILALLHTKISKRRVQHYWKLTLIVLFCSRSPFSWLIAFSADSEDL